MVTNPLDSVRSSSSSSSSSHSFLPGDDWPFPPDPDVLVLVLDTSYFVDDDDGVDGTSRFGEADEKDDGKS